MHEEQSHVPARSDRIHDLERSSEIRSATERRLGLHQHLSLLPMSTLSHSKGSSPVEHPTQVQPEPKASCRHRKSKKKYAALVWAGVAAAPRKPPESGGSKETLDSST
uniref:(northern house mosquito) hypothetical protein n=1 Tax=Culex pipiens TaxID=7175 RepID=A0A8D8CD47_CULPI